MTMHVKQRLSDGTVVLHDGTDGVEFVIRAEQWAELDQLPPSEQRAAVERFVLENRTSGDPRTQAEQEAMQTAHDAQTGEAHQEAERRE